MEKTYAVVTADKIPELTQFYGSSCALQKADGTLSGYWLLSDYFTPAQTSDVVANGGTCYDMTGFYAWFDTIKE